MSLLSICQSLESTSIGTWVRESAHGFAIVAGIHILGLTVSVGTLVWWDLRLLGASLPRCRASDVYRRLMPWTLSGFLAMFTSGAILFVAYATKAYGNLYFRIKLAALILAGANALIFHFVTERQIAQWDDSARPPRAAALAGLTSLVLWAVVIMAGRMMSYTMF